MHDECETEEFADAQNIHVEEELPGELRIPTQNLMQPAEKCREDTYQEQQESRGACVTEATTVRFVHFKFSDLYENR